jgi:hypothetical protein
VHITGKEAIVFSTNNWLMATLSFISSADLLESNSLYISTIKPSKVLNFDLVSLWGTAEGSKIGQYSSD